MRVHLENGKFLLYTTYEEKYRAQATGARWDQEQKRWEVEPSLLSGLMILANAAKDDDVEAARRFVTSMETPSPLLGFNLREKLMDHQVRGASELVARKRYFITFDMGCGKSATTMAAAQHLYHERLVDLMLVVCPISVFGSWERQLDRFLACPYRFIRFGRTKRERLTAFDDIKTIRRVLPWKRLIVLCVNYEALRIHERDLIKLKPGMVVFDESTYIKNRSAQMTKSAARISRAAEYVTALTGTPISNDVGDLFGQLHVVSPGFLGNDYWAFIREFATFGGYKNKEIVGTKNLKALDWIMRRCSYRVRKEEVLNLPLLTQETREIELEGEQQEAYGKAESDFYFAVEAVRKRVQELQGKDDPEARKELVTVLIRNAMSRLLRCQQIAGGHCRGEDGEMIYWPGNPKVREMVEIASQAGDQKVVVFSRFVENLLQGQKALREAGIDAEVYYGGTPHEGRARIENEFLRPDAKFRVVLVQVKTGGFGIDFSGASVAIFYDNWFSWSVRDQAQSRLHRLGQTRNVLCWDLVASRTVDEKVLETVLSKRSLSEVLFGKRVEALDKAAEELPTGDLERVLGVRV